MSKEQPTTIEALKELAKAMAMFDQATGAQNLSVEIRALKDMVAKLYGKAVEPSGVSQLRDHFYPNHGGTNDV